MSEKHLRVLGRIRLSREADEAGTSVERQREAIEQWSAMHGHQIVGWAIDSGVSGAVSPFDTPELGGWLKPRRLAEWDVLVAYRLDRLSRRVIPLNELFGFVQDHNKTLASVSESLDLSTWIGRLVANVIAGVAEGELEAIRERNLGSQRKVRQLGRWHGGTAPYGYRAVKQPDGWYLEPDPAEAAVLRDRVIPKVLKLQSTASIATELNQAGIPTRKATKWSGQVLRSILRNKAMLGQHEYKSRLVTDDDGVPVQRAEPLVTPEEFKQIQHALKQRSIKSGNREPNPMAGVLFCFDCGEPMYSQKMAGRSYGYYRCSNKQCETKSVRTQTADDLVHENLMEQIGNLERTVEVYVPGAGNAKDLTTVLAAIESARKEKDLGLYDGDEAEYLARLERLTQRKRELQQTSNPSGFKKQGTGETYAEAWDRMGPAERQELLLEAGIKLLISAQPSGNLRFHLDVPGDIREKLDSTV